MLNAGLGRKPVLIDEGWSGKALFIRHPVSYATNGTLFEWLGLK